MEMNPRKLVIGLLVLAALVLIYLAYTQVDKTPDLVDVEEMVLDPTEEATPDERDGLSTETEERGNSFVKKTRFIHKSQEGQIDREFGFEVLTNPEADQWTCTNPYMKLFLGDLDCYITADTARAQVDMSLKNPMPDDIAFSDNVVVRIVSTDPNIIEEAFIYLDDVAFVSEQSLFSSSGSVKFVSSVAQLKGHGLELIYDDLLGRLELFRIRDLESLRIRSDRVASLSSPIEPKPQAETTKPNAPGPEDTTQTQQPVAGETTARPQGDSYRCVFYRNVTIETPREIITAKERFAINNILWPESEPEAESETKAKNTEKPAGNPETATAGSEPVTSTIKPAPPQAMAVPGPNALDTTASKSMDLGAIPESFFDIIVTCDAGFVIAPTKGLHAISDLDDPNAPSPATEIGPQEPQPQRATDPNRSMIAARSVDVNVATTDTTLAGPVTIALGLDPNDLTGKSPGGELIPLNISAQKAVRFVATGNEILLEGPCRVTVQLAEPNYIYEYALNAPTLRLVLIHDPNAGPNDTGITLKRFTASGGPVTVRAGRRAGEKLVGWARLLATELDYRADEKAFTVRGPGNISLHNAEVLDVEADPNDMLNQPCFAFLRNFDSLTYSAATNRIVADVNSGAIQIDYFPLVEGAYDRRPIHADVGTIAIQLTQTADDRTELLSATASHGIAIEDEQTYECYGATLFYDHKTALVTVVGDESQPCYFNGASVDEVEINAETGAIRTHIRGPSILQINP